MLKENGTKKPRKKLMMPVTDRGGSPRETSPLKHFAFPMPYSWHFSLADRAPHYISAAVVRWSIYMRTA